MVATQQIPHLGPYELHRVVGRDGCGILYEGKHERHNRRVLVRAIAPEISNQENFIVRYELLRTILPRISHPNLLPTVELGLHQNVCVLVKELPEDTAFADMRSLEEMMRQESVAPKQLRAILQGIAQGLQALEAFRDSYFQNGIHHDYLHPAQILLLPEPALIGGGQTIRPLIANFVESFLFFGDEPQSQLLNRLQAPLFHASHREQEALGTVPVSRLFDWEFLYPPRQRQAGNTTEKGHIYSFGALAYWMLCGRAPYGVYPAATTLDASLPPAWDQMIDDCLGAPYDRGFASMDQVVEILQSQQSNEEGEVALPTELQNIEVPSGMVLVALPSKAELGAAGGPLVEQPRFRARLSPFFMDIAPVTVEQFSLFLSTYQPSTLSKGRDHPATQVSWHMAKAYCRWRSEQEGLPPDSYRLPTEYEWEAACRGAKGEQYPWGSDFEAKRLWCGHPSEQGALPIQSLPPGRFGLHDMLGNVWEWTESSFKPHPFSNHWEAGYEKSLKVVKGGCWVTPQKSCRGSLRAAFAPNERRGNIGFRCVRMAVSDD